MSNNSKASADGQAKHASLVVGLHTGIDSDPQWGTIIAKFLTNEKLKYIRLD